MCLAGHALEIRFGILAFSSHHPKNPDSVRYRSERIPPDPLLRGHRTIHDRPIDLGDLAGLKQVGIRIHRPGIFDAKQKPAGLGVESVDQP